LTDLVEFDIRQNDVRGKEKRKKGGGGGLLFRYLSHRLTLAPEKKNKPKNDQAPYGVPRLREGGGEKGKKEEKARRKAKVPE